MNHDSAHIVSNLRLQLIIHKAQLSMSSVFRKMFDKLINAYTILTYLAHCFALSTSCLDFK